MHNSKNCLSFMVVILLVLGVSSTSFISAMKRAFEKLDEESEASFKRRCNYDIRILDDGTIIIPDGAPISISGIPDRVMDKLDSLEKSNRPVDLDIDTPISNENLVDILNKIDSVSGLRKRIRSLKITKSSLVDEFLCKIALLENIETIEFSECNIRRIPWSIGFLKNLKELYLPGNSIATLPAQFLALKKLKMLDISGNGSNEDSVVIKGLRDKGCIVHAR